MRVNEIKNYFRNLSVKTHLILGVTLVHALLMVAFIVGHLSEEKVLLHDQLNENTMNLASTIGIAAAPLVLSRDLAGLEEIIGSEDRNSDLVYKMIISPDGTVLAHTNKKNVGHFVIDDVSRSLLYSDAKSHFTVDNEGVVEAAAPVFIGKKYIGWVRVASSRQKYNEQVAYQFGRGIVFAVFAIICGAFMAWLVARLLTRQLRDLTDATEAFRKGNRLVRADESFENEIGKLAANFNRVLDKLDVDEQKIKLSERKLRASEERLSIALNSSTDGFWDLNLNNLKIYFSDKWLALLGYEAAEIKPEYSEFIKLVHPDDFETRERIFEDHIKGLIASFESVHRLKHKNGNYLWIEEKGQVSHDEFGKANRFVCACLNVSEKKAAENEKELMFKQLQQSQKLEAIGHLTSGIAHDFNNILSGVMGFADLTMRRCAIDSNARNYLAKIIDSTNRAKTLVNQMVSFSASDNIQEQSLDVSKILAEETQMLRSIIPAEIEIDWQANTNAELVEVKMDRTELQQVVLNLCLNARDAIQAEKGKITVALAKVIKDSGQCVSCGSAVMGEWAAISVTDNGGGVAPDIQKKIFNPFFTTKPAGKGSGMGLAVVHGIVHRNGGHIEMQTSNEGSCFTLYLPLQKTENLELPVVAKANVEVIEAVAKPKIIVVDDEAVIREILSDLFTQMGYEVLAANNGLVAYHLIKEKGADLKLLITDQSMPVMNGTKLIGETRKILPDLPIIMITGNIANNIKELKTDLKVTEVLFKPFDINVLKTLVSGIIKKNKIAS